jgi:hypothetical protein
MALIRARKTISLNEVKTGQVLEIQYDGDTDLILVVDPKATTVIDTSQGRVGKLHAIKLRQLVESDLVDLISMVRSISTVNPRLIYDLFKSSPYAEGRRNYRTYTREKIGNDIKRISVGQSGEGTNSVRIGPSILYGVVHGSHVKIAMDDYDSLESQLRYRKYVTFFEGSDSHESVTQEVLKLCLSKNKLDEVMSKSKSWEPTIDPRYSAELYRVTELFGGESDTIWGQIKDAVKERNISTNLKLIDVLEATSGQSPVPKGSSFMADKVTAKQIRDLVILSGVSDSLLDKKYSSIEQSEFTSFHLEIQRRAFASYEGENYKQFVGSGIERKTTLISRIRQRNLYKLMRSTPAIYFAGDSHVDDMRKIYGD